MGCKISTYSQKSPPALGIVPLDSVGTNPTQCNPSNLDDGPWHGMPWVASVQVGSRSSRGDFNLWHRWRRAYPSPPVNSASSSSQLTHRRKPTPCVPSHPLMAPREPGSGIQQVRGALEQERTSPTLNTGTYHALYPRSWFVYEGVSNPAQCEQFSPIWAENYQETSSGSRSLSGRLTTPLMPHNPQHYAHLAEYGGLVYQCN